MRLRILLAAGATVFLMAGCADYGPGYYGPGPGYYYGPPADVDYDGYYDGYYGPIYDGYWGGGGVFFYESSPGGGWRRGGGEHFRHDQAPGFNHIHGTAHASPRGAPPPNRRPPGG